MLPPSNNFPINNITIPNDKYYSKTKWFQVLQALAATQFLVISYRHQKCKKWKVTAGKAAVQLKELKKVSREENLAT